VSVVLAAVAVRALGTLVVDLPVPLLASSARPRVLAMVFVAAAVLVLVLVR
jgi:hypothetical protein